MKLNFGHFSKEWNHNLLLALWLHGLSFGDGSGASISTLNFNATGTHLKGGPPGPRDAIRRKAAIHKYY